MDFPFQASTHSVISFTSRGLRSSFDAATARSLGASATKRKKKGSIFREHRCWAYLLLKWGGETQWTLFSSFGKNKVLAGGWRGRFSFSTTFQALAQPPEEGESLFLFQLERKAWDRSAPRRPHRQGHRCQREDNVAYCGRENRWGQSHPRDAKGYIYVRGSKICLQLTFTKTLKSVVWFSADVERVYPGFCLYW